MRNQSKLIFGIICLATGITVFLSMILPNWIFTTLTSFVLIGCGIALFLY